MEEKLKAIFEKSYGQGNIDVTKAGKNYKVKVKDSKIAYRVRYDGKVEKYEEMDPTDVYARLDDDGVLYLRATQLDNRYRKYNNSDSITSDWNTSGNATKTSVSKVIIEEKIAPKSLRLMFAYCSNLQIVENGEYIKTENVTDMYGVFGQCYALTMVNVSDFDTENVNNMNAMFNRM